MRLRLTPPSLPGPKFRIGASHWHAEGLSVGCLMGLPHAFSFRVPRPEQRSSRSPRADGREVAVLAASPDAMRVIPHLRISDADVEEALGVFAEVLSAVPA